MPFYRTAWLKAQQQWGQHYAHCSTYHIHGPSCPLRARAPTSYAPGPGVSFFPHLRLQGDDAPLRANTCSAGTRYEQDVKNVRG